jgi:hypothetical protein
MFSLVVTRVDGRKLFSIGHRPGVTGRLSMPETDPLQGGAVMTLVPQGVVNAVYAEAVRAVDKHGDNTPLNPDMDRRDKLVILVEELGEVGRCLTYDQDHAEDLLKELIELATMALMWASSETL